MAHTELPGRQRVPGCDGERNNCGGDNASCWFGNNMLALRFYTILCVCVHACVCAQAHYCVAYFEAVLYAGKAFQPPLLSAAQQVRVKLVNQASVETSLG